MHKGVAMNEQVTVEEGLKMLGTEFLYIYPDGETVRGYVKAFDLKVGLSCFSLETKASRGWTGNPDEGVDSDPVILDGMVYVPANDEHENIFIEPEYLCGPGEKYRTI